MKRNQIIKQAALISKTIGFFPVMILASYGYSRTYPMELFWLQLGLLTAAGYLGYLLMWIKVKLQDSLKNKPVAKTLILTGSYLIMFYLLIKISNWSHSTDTVMQLIFLVMSVIAFFIYMKDYTAHYSMVLTLEFLITITFIDAIAMYFCKAQMLGLIYLFIAAVYILIGNQLKIEELLERTRKNTPLFEDIKRQNGKWVCFVMSFILIVYPLRHMLLRGIKWIVIKFFSILFTVIAFIINLIPVTESSKEEMGQASGMGIMPAAETNKILELVLWIIFIAGIIFLLYKYRKSIITAVKEQLKKISRAIKKMGRFLFGKVNDKNQETDFYEDHIEELTSAEAVALYKKENITKRKWKKAVSRYLKDSIKENSLREGYKLILQGLLLKEVEIKAADTPREIRSQAEEKIKAVSLANETTAYEKIRYGNYNETEEGVNQIKEVLSQLLVMSK